MSELGGRSSARGDVFLLNYRHHDGCAPRLLDLLERGLAEAVCVNRELLGELAVAKNLDQHAAPLYQTRFAKRRFVNVCASSKALQIADVDSGDRDRERHAEPALRQATLDRGLTALEVQLADIAALAS